VPISPIIIIISMYLAEYRIHEYSEYLNKHRHYSLSLYNAAAQAVIRAFLNLMENIVIRALDEYLQKSMAITSIPFSRNIEIPNVAFVNKSTS